LGDVDNVVEAGGFFPIGMRVIDLAFEPGAWPIGGLVFGVEVNTAVGMGRGHDFDFEMEVFEWLFVADVEQVAAIAVRHQRAVLDFPGVGVFFGFFPAIKSFAVEKLDEAFFGIGGEQRL